MNKRHTRMLVLAVVALASAMAAHVLAQGQQPPKVQIPQSGVPQIMTIEGAYVRAAYNNEGYVILGYRLANTSVGEPWMLLDVGMTLRDNVPNSKLVRASISARHARRHESSAAVERGVPEGEPGRPRAAVANHQRLDQLLPAAGEPGVPDRVLRRAPAAGDVVGRGRAQPDPRVPGQALLPDRGRDQVRPGTWLNVKFEKSLIRVPLRILTKDEEKLLNKNFKSIQKQVEEAFAPPKK